ncbi:hypothetical protein D9758_012878 [Tetrapyrgos nigripes]|uniref:Uncharacterized protein n=1 Tax=Tetrapyrgos nigripes TaxID=182062 RepID=A0A8H5CM56_9AGAR|nr:hypothetical protein D9758_012878 [Tetrapyrgos nigripes]
MPLPRINSRTPLRDSSFGHKPNSMSISAWPPVVVPGRKSRSRLSIIFLLSLVLLSSYILIIQRSTITASFTLVPNSSESVSTPDIVLALEALKHSHAKLSSHQKAFARPQIELTPEQELAAVSSFLASLPQNIIPPFVDPSHPIDPQLVLDFDTRGPRAMDEMKFVTEQTWSHNPVFLYSKLYSPISREIKGMLHSMHLSPSPTMIDVDIRDDAEVLKPLIERLTSSSDLPILLIGGKPVGSITEIREMHESGELKQRILDAGAVVTQPKRKKHH